MEYDHQGQLLWTSDAARSWVRAKAAGASPPPLVEEFPVATFVAPSPKAGETIVFRVGRLRIGNAPTRAWDVMQHDRAGELRWQSPELRAKVEEIAQASIVARFLDGSTFAGSTITVEGGVYSAEGPGTISDDELAKFVRLGLVEWLSSERQEEWARRYELKELTNRGMLVATFFPGSGHDGRTVRIRRGDKVCNLDDGPVSNADLVRYDRLGWLLWDESFDWRNAVYEDASPSHQPGSASLVELQCVVLGGSGLPLRQGERWTLSFSSAAVEMVGPASERVDCPYAELVALEIGGPGEQQSGGGFFGGGFGIEGAVTGMLIGTALNLLTTRSSISTVICMQTNSAEVYFQNDTITPDVLRVRLSSVFTRLREVEAERQRRAPESNPRTPDVLEQLERLARLHQAGAITDQEFAAFKAKLMQG